MAPATSAACVTRLNRSTVGAATSTGLRYVPSSHLQQRSVRGEPGVRGRNRTCAEENKFAIQVKGSSHTPLKGARCAVLG